MQTDFRGIVENLHDGFYYADHERRISFWNKAAERITGYSARDILGKSCRDNILIHVDAEGTSLCLNSCPLAATVLDGASREAAVFLHHKLGHRVPVQIRVSPVRDFEGKIIGATELFTDLSPDEFLWEKVQEYQRLALIDPLTELPNRKYLDQHIHAQLAQLERYRLPFGLLSFTLLEQPCFIERHGLSVMEKALQVIGLTLRHNLRPYDIVGRNDSDEFLGIFPNVDADYLNLIGKRLCVLIQNSIIEDAQGNRCYLDLQVCAATAQEGDSVVKLLERLDYSPLVP